MEVVTGQFILCRHAGGSLPRLRQEAGMRGQQQYRQSVPWVHKTLCVILQSHSIHSSATEADKHFLLTQQVHHSHTMPTCLPAGRNKHARL